MKNMIDITNVTDAVLDCYLRAKAQPEEEVDVSHLTTTERYQIAELFGWKDVSPAWLHGYGR